MTTNQSNLIVKNPNTKKALQVLQRYARAEATLKALEKEQKEATALLLDAMDMQGIRRMEIDMPGLTGYITLAKRTTYKADDIMEVDVRYLKSVLDTDKVKAEAVLTGKLPDGVSESTTQYITKKLKVGE